MNWTQLLDERRVRTHRTSHEEIADLRRVVARDLADAALPGLSADRCFATAYNAALQLSKMVLACAGYRVVGAGHHQTAWQAVELAMGSDSALFAAYFDDCRRKRNLVDYDMANVTTQMEAEQIVLEANNFRQFVEAWIAASHSEFALPAV